MKYLIALLAVTCFVGCSDINTGASTIKEMEQTEANQQRLVKADPPPVITRSLERKNLVARLERINKNDMLSYIYLVSYGKVMAHYTIRGKVSSLNSLLTTPQQVIAIRNSGTVSNHVLPSPDFDGSYGKNADGIFFFTTEGAYVEWEGSYLWCDQPLRLTTQPELIQNIKDAK